MEYLDYIPRTIEEAKSGLQVSTLKVHNAALAELSITKLVNDTSLMCGSEWPGAIIVSTIDRIISQYWVLKIEELAYIFQSGAQGFYGKIYGSFKPSDLLDWIRQYDTGERVEYFQRLNGTYKEPYEKYFQELEEKEAQDLRQETKQMTKKFEAAAKAKRKIDNEN